MLNVTFPNGVHLLGTVVIIPERDILCFRTCECHLNGNIRMRLVWPWGNGSLTALSRMHKLEKNKMLTLCVDYKTWSMSPWELATYTRCPFLHQELEKKTCSASCPVTDISSIYRYRNIQYIDRYRWCLTVGWKAEQVMLPISLQCMTAIQVNKGILAACSQGVILQVLSSTHSVSTSFFWETNLLLWGQLWKDGGNELDIKESLLSWRLYSPLLLMSGWGFCNEINPQLQMNWKMFCSL